MAQEPPFSVIPIAGGIRKTRPYDDAFISGDAEALVANCGKFTLEGGFLQHGGLVTYTPTGVGSAIVWMKRWYKQDGTKYFLALSEAGTLYRVSDSTPATFTSLYTGLSGSPYTSAEINGWLYLGNGVDPFLRYDGTTIVVVGAEVPALGSMSLLGVSGGTLAAGTYNVAITFEYGTEGVLGESNLSTPLAVTVAANFSINIFDIPVSSRADVHFKSIYRTLVDGSIYYFVDRIPNTQTTYTIQAGDAELSVSNFEAEINHDIPPNLGSIASFRGLLFGIDPNVPNRIRFSLSDGSDVFPDDPEYYSDELSTGDGERVTSLFRFGDTLYASKKTKIWALSGDSNASFIWDEVPGSLGIVSEQSVRKADRVVFGLGQRDIVVFDGIQSIALEKVRGLLDIVNDINKPEAYGVYRDKRYYIAVQTGSATRRALLLVVSIDPTPGSEGFPVSTIQNTGFEVSSLEAWGNENDRIFVGGYDGRIYEFDLGVDWSFEGEDPVGADFQWKSNWIWISNPAQFKRFLKTWLMIESEGGDVTMTYDFLTDDPNDISSGTQDISLDPVISGAGNTIGIYNYSRWG